MRYRSSTAARIGLPTKYFHWALIVLSFASRKPAQIGLLPKNLQNAPELLRRKARDGRIRNVSSDSGDEAISSQRTR